MKFREWFDDYPKLQVLPWERTGKGRLGNELQDTATGGKILGSPFKSQKKDFDKLLDLPTESKTPKKDGLGELGMSEVGRSTFNPSPIPAGATPTLSNGMPVGESVVTQAQDDLDKRIEQFPPQLRQAMSYLRNKTIGQQNNAAGDINNAVLDMMTAKGGYAKGMQMARDWKKEMSRLPRDFKSYFGQSSQKPLGQPNQQGQPNQLQVAPNQHNQPNQLLPNQQ